MFKDLRSDAVGSAINLFHSKEKWDAEKYSIRDQLFEELKRQNYIKAALGL